MKKPTRPAPAPKRSEPPQDSSPPPAAASLRKYRILLVDDHPIMREGLSLLIQNENDLIVCGESEDAPNAVSLAEKLKPDLALVDLSLKESSGLELIKDLKAVLPDMPVLALSMHEESLYAERVLKAGGRGYIMKQEGGKKLMGAIRQVLAGQVYVSEAMSARILDLFTGRRQTSSDSPVSALTDREFEIFEMIGQGKGTREIAKTLNLSVKTVEVHRSHIKEKLKIKDAPSLVRDAVRWVESRSRIN